MIQSINYEINYEITFVILVGLFTLLVILIWGIYILMVVPRPPIPPGAACPCGRFYIIEGTRCPCFRKWSPRWYIRPKL